MSVLIKGMEMPTGCSALTLKIWPDGQVEIIDADGEWKTSEAVPVPPHGDLIERDALMKLFGMGADCHTLSHGDDGFRLKHSGMGADCYNCQHGDSHGQCGFGPLFSDMCEALDNAPVIIEEERSDV